MKIFLDSVDLDTIRELNDCGLVDGITTNPSILAKSGQDYSKIIEKLCSLIKGPVSIEAISTNYQEMINEGINLSKLASNVVVKLPLTFDGLRACSVLSKEYGIKVNLTLCFSSGQAILAAKCGAFFVSPFIGRLDDLNYDGMILIDEICSIYKKYDKFTTQVLAASIRSPLHVVKAAKLGADIVTVPPSVLKQLISHPLTDKGLDIFLKDWKIAGQSIIKKENSII